MNLKKNTKFPIFYKFCIPIDADHTNQLFENISKFATNLSTWNSKDKLKNFWASFYVEICNCCRKNNSLCISERELWVGQLYIFQIWIHFSFNSFKPFGFWRPLLLQYSSKQLFAGHFGKQWKFSKNFSFGKDLNYNK